MEENIKENSLKDIEDLNEKLTNSKLESILVEPVKPPVPYVLFFRDTVTTITKQNANVEFEEIKKIVETLWNSLSPENKLVYENKYKEAKIEYQYAMVNYLKNKQTNDDPQVETKPIELNENSNSLLCSSNIVADDNISQSSVLQTSSITGLSSESQTASNSDSGVIKEKSEENRKCLRNGCNNLAVEDPDWEDEYCNNECVVLHCRTVFNNWVQHNKPE